MHAKLNKRKSVENLIKGIIKMQTRILDEVLDSDEDPETRNG